MVFWRRVCYNRTSTVLDKQGCIHWQIAFREDKMKDVFITKLILEKVRNLSRIEIPLSSENRKHLIFTGKNGSGKTTILDGLAWYLNQLALTNKLVCNENVLLAERKFSPIN